MAPSYPNISTFFFAILVVALAVVSEPIVSPAPTGGGNPFCYEECLKQAFNNSPATPTPAHLTTSNRIIGGENSRSILCKDLGRAYFDSVRITGKLPQRYLLALCRVLKDQGKVEEYVKATFSGRNLERLFDSRSCEMVTAAAGKHDPCSVV